MLEIFALAVLLVLTATAIAVFVVVGRVPGAIARKAGHPQAEAINILAWFGLAFGGLGWVLALVWSKTNPGPDPTEELRARLASIEQRLGMHEEEGL